MNIMDRLGLAILISAKPKTLFRIFGMYDLHFLTERCYLAATHYPVCVGCRVENNRFEFLVSILLDFQ
jgi:hypothetical protein